MARKFAPLLTTHVKTGTEILRPQEIPEVLHLHDPALNAMIDFHFFKPMLIRDDKRMYDARLKMQPNRKLFHLVFVINQNYQLVGALSLEKIMTEIPIKFMQEKRIKRDKVLVKQVMRPLEEIAALQYEDLKFARVGDVVETLHARKQHYALAIQPDPNSQKPIICGAFLASLLSEQLGMDVLSKQPNYAKTLAELNHIASVDYV